MNAGTSTEWPNGMADAIGVFDSGLGGLSVLRSLRSTVPNARWLYAADSGHAPYGERSVDHVTARSLAVAAGLIDRGARMLVVACNTATALAVPALRERWPDLPVIGVEPGIKPAVTASRSRRIGVMATEGTLRSDRFRALLDRVGGAHDRPIDWTLQPCPGLAQAIEEADLDSAQVTAVVNACCEPLRASGVDTVVLGCTHYPFVAGAIQRALGDAVQLIDTADAVAREAARRWRTDARKTAGAAGTGPAGAQVVPPLPRSPSPWPTTTYFTTGDVAKLEHAARGWLGDAQARALPWSA